MFFKTQAYFCHQTGRYRDFNILKVKKKIETTCFVNRRKYETGENKMRNDYN